MSVDSSFYETQTQREMQLVCMCVCVCVCVCARAHVQPAGCSLLLLKHVDINMHSVPKNYS